VSIVTGNPVVPDMFINASKRRVVAIDGDTANGVTLAEVNNTVSLIGDNNYANIENKYNRVA
jgi:hypothetical protein